jgi:hypothetical protein
MNFISKMMEGGSNVHVELKYCERCGGLFLRTQGSNVVYCTGCAGQLAAKTEVIGKCSPSPYCRKRSPRTVKEPTREERRAQGMAQIEYLQGVATIEVRIW